MTDQELFINNLIEVVSPQHTTSSPERKLDILNEWLYTYKSDAYEKLEIENSELSFKIDLLEREISGLKDQLFEAQERLNEHE